MKEKILLYQDVINDTSLSAEAICVYVAIRSFAVPNDDDCFINNTKLEYYLFGGKMGRNEHLAMTKGLKDLTEKSYIKVIQKLNSTDYIYNYKKINNSDVNRYFYVYRDDIRKIMSLDVNYNKYKMLRYYVCLLRTFNNDKNKNNEAKMKIGFQTQSTLSNLSNLSISTINEYNNIFEKEKIIYIVKTIRGNSSSLKRQIIYSRYSDKDLCNDYCKKRNINVNLTLKMKQSDSRRRDIEIYKHMIKGKVYDDDTVKRVFKTIDDINSSIIIGCESDEYNDIFDMSIFKQYGII